MRKQHCVFLLGLTQTMLVNESSYMLESLDLSSSKNKGADQLRGYCVTDLHLCFRKCKMFFFFFSDMAQICVFVDRK